MNELDEVNVLWLKKWAGTLTEEEQKALEEYHRHPKTHQERKKASPVDGEPKIRAKRNKTNLPDSWDDMTPEAQRSWKKQRKTQFK